MYRVSLALLIFVVFYLGRLSSQECENLRNATPEQLVAFLNENSPSEDTSQCITYAIAKLGEQRYEPAISALVRLLGFQRPPTDREKRGYHIRMQASYPAVEAIAQLGKSTLPAILEALRSDTGSPLARANAVFAWMEIYKYEKPAGIAALRQAVDRATDASSKQNLKWAVSKAMSWCSPIEETECKEAAAKGRENR